MFRYSLAISLVLSLTSCTDPFDEAKQQAERERIWKADEDKLVKIVSDKMNRGEVREVKYYPQPDLTEGRWFKVEDQVGCRWWINSGHKFDKQFIVLKQDGDPDCDNPKMAPLQNRRLVDKNGNDFHP